MAVPDITQYFDNPDITNAQNQANQTAQTATNYNSAASLLPSALKNAIEQKLNYNKDIIDAQSKAEANYFAAPAQARAQYQDIFNPFDREALVAQSVANAYAPYQSLTDILGQRQGNISDIVNAGVGAFNSQVSAEQGAASIAQNNLQNLMAKAQNLASAKEWQYQAGLPAGYGSSSSIAEAQALAALQKDIQSGMTYHDLLARYGGTLNEFQIRQAYNNGPLAKRFGPAKETPTQEANILSGLPGLTGAKAAPKASSVTISPMTTTQKGRTSTTGWKLKLTNGSTVTVYPAPANPGFFGLGASPSKTQGIDPQQVVEQYKSAGATDQQIIQRLQAMGFEIQ